MGLWWIGGRYVQCVWLKKLSSVGLCCGPMVVMGLPAWVCGGSMVAVGLWCLYGLIGIVVGGSCQRCVGCWHGFVVGLLCSVEKNNNEKEIIL